MRVLQKHRLSVFAPHQQWALQGDFILDSVSVAPSSGIRGPYWSADRGTTTAPWSDFRHLDLVVPNPGAVTWTVSLPSGLQHAEFHSAIDLGPTTEKISEPVTFAISVQAGEKPEQLILSQSRSAEQHGWQPISIPLDPYIGQTITLRLTAQAESIDRLALYRFPYIDAQFDSSSSTSSDLAENRFMPTPTPRDLGVDFGEGSRELTYGMKLAEGTTDTWSIDERQLLPSKLPSLIYLPPLNECLNDYSHLSIKVAAPAELYPRAIEIHYRVDNADAFDTLRPIIFPLHEDGALHEYIYDLKLLQLPYGAHLTGLQLSILGKPYRAVPGGQYAVQISNLRFIRNDRATGCGR